MYRIPYEEMERMVIGDRVTRLTAKYLDRRLAPAELTEVGNTLRKRCGRNAAESPLRRGEQRVHPAGLSRRGNTKSVCCSLCGGFSARRLRDRRDVCVEKTCLRPIIRMRSIAKRD